MEPGDRTYFCDDHGYFDVDVTDLAAIWHQPCPACGAVCELRRRRETGLVLGHPPAVHGDIAMPYWSPYVNRMISSRADVRRAHQELGVAPLSDSDLKHAAEQSETVAREAREEDRWLARAGSDLEGLGNRPLDAPLPTLVDAGDEPEGVVFDG